MPTPGAQLCASALSVAYGQVEVLHGLDLAVAPGEMTALVGPNGSGKSTFLSTLVRLLKPAGGEVLLDGRVIHSQPTREVARRLGILPQSPLVPEAITVFDLVCRGRYPHQGLVRQWSAADAASVKRAMELTEIIEFTDRPVDSLSGGQRQRCWIAMTLAQETEIILLDEPTTFLDIHYQVEILSLLRRLCHEHGRTIVVVLHDLNFAAAYADRLVMMKDGRVHCAGPTGDVFTAEAIEAVFGVPVHVLTHPDSNKPWCLPKEANASPEVRLAAE